MAGAPLTPQPRVRLADAAGRTVASGNPSIQLTLQPVSGSGSLGGTATVAAANGIATFAGLTISGAGTYRLVASASGQAGIAPATSNSFEITALAQPRLDFGIAPGPLETVDVDIAPALTVRVLNADGTLNAASTAAVTLALGTNPGTATLAGTLTRAAVNGVATFPGVRLSAPGTGYTLVASAQALAAATSAAFEVRPQRLVFTQQPRSLASQQTLAPAPVVGLVDAENVPITAGVGTVVLSLDRPAGNGATLGGTTSVPLVGGVATFGNLQVNGTGAGFTLTAASQGRTSVTSTAFDVTAGTALEAAQLAAGNEYTMALKRDGTVWVWGSGQLGAGTVNATVSPTLVAGLPPVRAIAAGKTHLLALTRTGRVFAWGVGVDGQLGLGASPVETAPREVQGLANIVAIAANPDGDFSMALRDDGAVFTWGANESGQLGDGTLTARRTPVRLTAPVLTSVAVTGIAAGAGHALARRNDGTVVSWGNDAFGQLGDDIPLQNRATPAVIPGLTGVAAVTAGSLHSFALFADRRARGWGDARSGQLGQNTGGVATSPADFVTTSTLNPSPPANVVNDFVALAAGNGFTIGLRANGQVLSWGNNAFGKLGNGRSGSSESTSFAAPVDFPSSIAVRLITAGRQHALFAIDASGELRCWGDDNSNQCAVPGFGALVPTPLNSPFSVDR